MITDPRSIEYVQTDPLRPPAPRNTLPDRHSLRRIARAGGTMTVAPSVPFTPQVIDWAAIEETALAWSREDAWVANADGATP